MEWRKAEPPPQHPARCPAFARLRYLAYPAPAETSMRALSVSLLLGFAAAAHAESVSFRQDVMPVLSRAGCNQGACHGNLNGKGGFKLSLRGEDPAADLVTLTRDMLARRTSPTRPDESLILRKAAGLVAHEGGPRFSVDSQEYRILRQWIADGCRDDRPTCPDSSPCPSRRVANPLRAGRPCEDRRHRPFLRRVGPRRDPPGRLRADRRRRRSTSRPTGL